MNRLSPFTLVLIATLMVISGCSRVTLVYNTADFFAKQYATDYLNLAEGQIANWEPHLDAELARHRSEELPFLASFFDSTLKSSRAGFDERNMSCLTTEFRDLYRRHAQLAVTLAAPLLADLTPAQIDALERTFRKQARKDREDLATREISREKQKRTKRYVEAIEDWTGPLKAGQPDIVADVTGRMPDSEAALVDYRTRKREELLSLLRNRSDEPPTR